MAEQTRVEKPKQERSTAAELEQLAEDDAAVQEAQSKPAADLSDLDDLLDEIDGLLEEQEVLTNFRQRGGQ
jgi:hypothetical protein